MAPIHQGIAPTCVGYVSVGSLSRVTMDVAYNFAHVGNILFGVVGFALVQNLHDSLSRLVTNRFVAVGLLAH